MEIDLKLNKRKVVRESIYYDCPFCNDTKGHLNIHPAKGVYRCNRCGTGGTLNSLKRELNIPQSSKPEFKPAKKLNPQLEMASIEVRHKTYSQLLRRLPLLERHRVNLLDRGLTDKEIRKLGYKSIPRRFNSILADKLLRSGCELEGVSGFYHSKKNGWTFYSPSSGILIPFRDEKGRIKSLQVRVDKKKDGPRYKWVSSAGFWHGAPVDTSPHITIGGLSKSTVVLTEGALKADVAAFLSKRKNVSWVGIAGVNNTGKLAELLRKVDIDTALLEAFDMDKFQNENVKKATERMTELIKKEGFAIQSLIWDGTSKGIDDALLERKLNVSLRLNEERKSSKGGKRLKSQNK